MKKTHLLSILITVFISLFSLVAMAQPAAPNNVIASDGLFTTKVNITWLGSPGLFFQVYRNTQNNAATATAISGWQTSAIFDDNTAVIGTTFYYWIKASASSSGANPSGFSISNDGYRAPAAPSSVSSTEGGSSYLDKVKVSWSFTAGYSYRLFRSTVPNPAQATAITNWITATTFDDINVVDGVMYYYWVKSSVSPTGTNPSLFSSPEVKGHSGFNRPWNIAATDGVYTDWAKISWNGIWGPTFKVFRNTNNTPVGAVPVSGLISSVFFEDKTAVPGTLYYYFVQASNSVGQNQSPLYEFDQGYRAVRSPINITATISTCGKIWLMWTPAYVPPPSNPVTYYRVYRSLSSNSATAVPLGNGWFTGTSFDDLTAPANTNCYYWIKASAYSDGTRPSAFSSRATGYRPSCFGDDNDRELIPLEVNKENQFEVMPNPASDFINVSLQVDKAQLIELTLINQFGIPVRNLISDNMGTDNQNIQVPVGDLPVGMYFIAGTINNTPFRKKVLIVR